MYFGKKYQYMVMGVSFSVCIIVILITLNLGLYIPVQPYTIPLNQKVNNIFISAILVALIPPAIVEFFNAKWLDGVESNIPLLLRDVTEDVKAGLPLIQSLEIAATRNYGPVSEPLRKAMIKFRLTSDLDESLRWLGKTLVKPVAIRMSTVLIEAYQTGGDVVDVLESSAILFTEINEFRETRKSQTGPYVSIVYVGVIIFLLISWVLLTKFLVPLYGNGGVDLNDSGLSMQLMNMNFYKSVLFWAAVMESVLGGLLAGKISVGKVSAGLLHSVILLSLTLMFFNLFVV